MSRPFCGLELAEQLPDLDAVFVALGDGGLIADIGTWLAEARLAARIIGCPPESSLQPCTSACGQGQRRARERPPRGPGAPLERT